MPTKTELLNQHLDRIFADRQAQLELFENLLTSAVLRYSLLAIRGIGGIGKTMLLNAFQKLCLKYQVPVALIDVGIQRSIVEVLRSMRDQLVQTGPDFTCQAFDEEVERYLTLDAQLRRLGTIPIG